MENKTLEVIQKKFGVDLNQESSIKLPYDRFHDLPALFKELGFTTGAEIGVSTGRYSKWLCVKHRKLKLYCIDPWIAYDEYVEAHDEKGQIVLNENLEIAKERLKSFNCEFVRKTSMEAVKDFKDESLDFVFIDGNHTFEYVVDDIAQWSKKVKKGGIISGHDYWNSIDLERTWAETPTYESKLKLCQVKDAIDAWTKTNKIKPWFVLKKGKDNSWFYVKQ